MYSIQVDIDMPAAARAVDLSREAMHDAGTLLKTVLTQLCGGPVVRPWRLHSLQGPLAVVVGYTDVSPADLLARAALAMPALRGAVRGVHGHELPPLAEGQRFRFSVRLCPTISVGPGDNRRYGERDAYLMAAEAGEAGTREAVYRRYVADRLHGAQLDAVRLSRFRLVEMVRPHRGADAPASGMGRRTMPVADLAGMLTVTDPHTLTADLRAGIGRGRAYGLGYVRLEPQRLN